MHSGSLAEAVPGAEASTSEIRVEIASVEAEGRRLVDAFGGLEEAAIRDSDGGFDGGGGADDWTEPPMSSYKQPLKPALKNSSTVPAGHRMSVASSLNYINYSPSTTSSSSFQFANPFNGNATNTAPPLSTLSRNLSRIKPSTSTATTSASGASVLSRSGSSTTQRGRPSVDRITTHLATTMDDPEAAALEATILDLRRRKKDTEDRYQRRLEFLRGKLRAAELKEKAMR